MLLQGLQGLPLLTQAGQWTRISANQTVRLALNSTQEVRVHLPSPRLGGVVPQVLKTKHLSRITDRVRGVGSSRLYPSFRTLTAEFRTHFHSPRTWELPTDPAQSRSFLISLLAVLRTMLPRQPNPISGGRERHPWLITWGPTSGLAHQTASRTLTPPAVPGCPVPPPPASPRTARPLASTRRSPAS